MCELLIFLSIYWRLILFYFIFAPSSHPFPWQSHLCNSSRCQEFYMFVPFLLLRLWHRGVGTGTALHLPGWGYGLFVVLTPVRVLSMADTESQAALWIRSKGPCVFFPTVYFPSLEGVAQGPLFHCPTPSLPCTLPAKIPPKHRMPGSHLLCHQLDPVKPL